MSDVDRQIVEKQPAGGAPDAAENACLNCAARLVGRYCHDCGQKAIADADRRLTHLLGEVFRELTSLDGKLWRSLITLVRSPGQLSLDYIRGRRARFVSPVSLFLLGNLIYFFAPAITDFNLPFVDQVPGRLGDPVVDADRTADESYRQARAAHRGGQLHSRWTAPLVEARVAERAARDPAYTIVNYAAQYDAESANVSKLLIIVHVPFLGLLLALLFAGRGRYFAEHLVVAFHLFAFLLLFVQMTSLLLAPLLSPLLSLLPRGGARVLLPIVPLMLCWYFASSFRRAYAVGWWRAAAATLAFWFGLFLVHVAVYRTLQFLIVFALT